MKTHNRIVGVVGVVALVASACSSPPRPKYDRADLFEPMLESPTKTELEEPVEKSAGHATVHQVAPNPRIAGDEEFALQLRGVALAEAFHLIATQAGANLYLDAGLSGMVDADFPSVTLDDALTSLLSRNGMRLVEDPPGIFFVELADGSQQAIGEFQLESTPAAQAIEGLQALIGDEAVVVADTTHNFIIVRGSQNAVEAAGRFLDQVDQLQPQVLVEMHIFEVTMDDSFELGLNSTFNRNTASGPVAILSNLANGVTPFRVNLVDDDGEFETTLSALQSYIDLELVSSPRVLAITNSEATIEVIEEIPYIDVSTVTSGTTGGVGSTTQESVLFKEAGIKMKVRPTIQEDGTLMIEMNHELSEVAEFFNEIPVLDTRRLVSQFLVRDGETVVLGGLTQDRHIEEDRGVPILMHIPLIGHLFRGDVDSSVKRQLLLFVTPRILDPDQASRLAPHYRESFRDGRRKLKGEAE